MSLLEDAALDSFHSQINRQASREDDPKLKLKANDIYKELRLRGYDYRKDFQGIFESNNAGNGGAAFVDLHFLASNEDVIL